MVKVMVLVRKPSDVGAGAFRRHLDEVHLPLVASGELLGNYPQAFSHIGLVNAAWAISQAEQRGEPHAPAAEVRTS
jgi:hypothetical protein